MTQTKAILYCWLVMGITLCAATNALATGRGAFAGDSVGARASIFGEAFVAVADDANALKWNPAGITQDLWYHEQGCGSWLKVTRNTVTHEIEAVEAVAGTSA